jgi:branched-chain amino acid transport system ATP-binding protein
MSAQINHIGPHGTGGPVLKVSNLKKAYGAIKAVDGVSFEVMPGEIFGVIGPNGSGKTTMFNSVLGQIDPDEGSIALNGQDITRHSPQELNRRGVGRTFQTLQVFGKMSVRDNLIVAAQEHVGTMAGRMFAPGDSGLGAKADALIDQFRIRHVAHKKAGELSYGQQKLVDIAMAFMSEPDLVLLDEPCAGVNPSLVGGIRTLLKELNQTRKGSFVVIEHNMDFVMSLCHRILVMVEGKVMAVGTPAEIRANRQVLDAYLGN